MLWLMITTKTHQFITMAEELFMVTRELLSVMPVAKEICATERTASTLNRVRSFSSSILWSFLIIVY